MTKKQMLNLVSRITTGNVVVTVTTDKDYGNGMNLAEWLKQTDAQKD